MRLLNFPGMARTSATSSARHPYPGYHLAGALYTARMRPGIEPIPVAEYRLSGQNWNYEQ